MKVTRTIDVDMSDRMRFAPAKIIVKQGETICLRVTNSGTSMHELVHDAPSMAHVAPGRTQSMVWQFTQPGEFQYGCLIPGHFEAGMIGTVRVISN